MRGSPLTGTHDKNAGPPVTVRTILRVQGARSCAGTRQHSAIRDDKTDDPDPAGPATTGVADKLVPHGPRPTAPLNVREMKRVGLIGCGAIGRPVARALLSGKAGDWSAARWGR
jgi:hypothetical protein